MKQKLAFASSNYNKILELQQLAATTPYELLAQHHFGVVDVEENGNSFTENALIKAYNLAKYTKLVVIADDSGLIVDGLDGMPGIKSARFAGAKATAQDNCLKLQQLLLSKNISQASAKFHTTMVLVREFNDRNPIVVQGELSGIVIADYQPQPGFGYEPMFYLADYDCTLTKLSRSEKSKISHRAQAFNKLLINMQEII